MGRGGLNGVCVAAGLKPKHVAREAPILEDHKEALRGVERDTADDSQRPSRTAQFVRRGAISNCLLWSNRLIEVITANEYTPCLCVSCPFHTSPPYTTTNLIDTLALTGGNTHIGDIYILVHLV